MTNKTFYELISEKLREKNIPFGRFEVSRSSGAPKLNQVPIKEYDDFFNIWSERGTILLVSDVSHFWDKDFQDREEHYYLMFIDKVGIAYSIVLSFWKLKTSPDDYFVDSHDDYFVFEDAKFDAWVEKYLNKTLK